MADKVEPAETATEPEASAAEKAEPEVVIEEAVAVEDKQTDEPAEEDDDSDDGEGEGDEEDDDEDDDYEEDDEDDEEGEEGEEEAEEDDEKDDDDEEAYRVKLKPELAPEIRVALKKRNTANRKLPDFKRQEWHRYKRLGDKWRRPKGLHSKQRRGLKYRSPTVKAGYGSPALARGLHPSGFVDVLVHRVEDLEGLDPKTQAVRIGRRVGLAKRQKIHESAEEQGLRILNPTRRRLAQMELYRALTEEGEQ